MARTTDGTTADAPTPEDLELPAELGDGFLYLGTDDNPELRAYDNSADPAGVVHVYARPGDPNHQIGIYVSETFADDGYPWVAAKNYVDVDGERGWKHTHICESVADALKAARDDADRHVNYSIADSGSDQ